MKPAITETIICCAVRLYMLVESTQDQHDFSCRWLKVKTPLLLAVVKTRTLSRYLSHRFIPDFVTPFNVLTKCRASADLSKNMRNIKKMFDVQTIVFESHGFGDTRSKVFWNPLFNSFRYMGGGQHPWNKTVKNPFRNLALPNIQDFVFETYPTDWDFWTMFDV